MTRIPLLSDDKLAPVAHEVIGGMQTRGAKVPDLYRMLANAPELLKAWTDLSWPLRNSSRTPRGLRELLIMRTAHLTKARYEWAHHWRLAVEAGVSDAKLNALTADWRVTSLFEPAERAALDVADALVLQGGISDEGFAAFAAHFDAGEMVHFAMTVSFYVCVAHMASAFELDLEAEYRKS